MLLLGPPPSAPAPPPPPLTGKVGSFGDLIPEASADAEARRRAKVAAAVAYVDTTGWLQLVEPF